MKYERVLTEIYRKPWAILHDRFDTITEIVRMRAAGEKLTEDDIRSRLAPSQAARREPQMKMLAARNGQGQDFGVVALIPIYGVISHRMNLMSQISGGTSVEKLTAQFRQAVADPSVKAIAFDIDSPGGSVEGVSELAEEIFKSRSKKKTVAVANALAASAAYWLGSAADEFVVIPSGQVGSIGVFCEHMDISEALAKDGVKISLISAGKYKVEGNPYEPLSDEARAAMQEKVDAYYDMFVKSVAKARGVSQAAVREGFGQARCIVAAEALKQKMVDGVATLDQTLARLGATAAPKKMSAAAAPGEIVADLGDGDPTEDPDDCDCACSACETGNCATCTNAECADAECAAGGCPSQDVAAKCLAKGLAAMARRRRELDLYQ